MPDVRKIIAFRNLLMHGYAVIDDGRVCHSFKSCPPLIRQKPACSSAIL
ncbi:HepT-like ribonuclease domain-containing protein [Bradyrhizobium frederickii]